MSGSRPFIPNNLLMPEVMLKEFQADQIFEPCSTYVILISVSKVYEKMEQEFQHILSPAEIQKSKRFVYDHDRKSYLVRKCILRILLAKYNTIDPQKIRFSTLENKKPIAEGIEFNVSHSGDFVAIALGPSKIGIDIEYVNTGFDFKSLIRSCFNEQESEFISTGNALLNFYTLWTRKEALLKATGEGLIDTLPLLNCLSETIDRKGATFRLNTREIQKGYIFSLCTLATEVTEPIYLIFQALS